MIDWTRKKNNKTDEDRFLQYIKRGVISKQIKRSRRRKLYIMKKTLIISFIALFLAGAGLTFAAGFDQYGYNYQARLFSGKADGVDKDLDGTVWGNPTYANDHLVMKWNAQWDNCNANGNNDPKYCLGAWVDNEWNGNVPGGSGVSEHYKIVWVGSEGQNSPYWVDGGSLVWGNYETIMDQGTDAGHFWSVHGIPSGYGVK